MDVASIVSQVIRRFAARIAIHKASVGDGGSGLTKAALTAAADMVERAPTDEQKAAGNYRKGHVSFWGIPITIETASGTERSGKDADGKAWSVTLPHHYGYVKRTESEADGDHVDVFLCEHDLDSDKVFVVNQVIDGRFDEHKCMLGCRSEDEAKQAYLNSYSPGWKGFGGTVEMTIPQFKVWLAEGDTSKPAVAAADSRVEKFNPNHDARGRFTSAPNVSGGPGSTGGASRPASGGAPAPTAPPASPSPGAYSAADAKAASLRTKSQAFSRNAGIASDRAAASAGGKIDVGSHRDAASFHGYAAEFNDKLANHHTKEAAAATKGGDAARAAQQSTKANDAKATAESHRKAKQHHDAAASGKPVAAAPPIAKPATATPQPPPQKPSSPAIKEGPAPSSGQKSRVEAKDGDYDPDVTRWMARETAAKTRSAADVPKTSPPGGKSSPATMVRNAAQLSQAASRETIVGGYDRTDSSKPVDFSPTKAIEAAKLHDSAAEMHGAVATHHAAAVERTERRLAKLAGSGDETRIANAKAYKQWSEKRRDAAAENYFRHADAAASLRDLAKNPPQFPDAAKAPKGPVNDSDINNPSKYGVSKGAHHEVVGAVQDAAYLQVNSLPKENEPVNVPAKELLRRLKTAGWSHAATGTDTDGKTTHVAEKGDYRVRITEDGERSRLNGGLRPLLGDHQGPGQLEKFTHGVGVAGVDQSLASTKAKIMNRAREIASEKIGRAVENDKARSIPHAETARLGALDVGLLHFEPTREHAEKLAAEIAAHKETLRRLAPVAGQFGTIPGVEHRAMRAKTAVLESLNEHLGGTKPSSPVSPPQPAPPAKPTAAETPSPDQLYSQALNYHGAAGNAESRRRSGGSAADFVAASERAHESFTRAAEAFRQSGDAAKAAKAQAMADGHMRSVSDWKKSAGHLPENTMEAYRATADASASFKPLATLDRDIQASVAAQTKAIELHLAAAESLRATPGADKSMLAEADRHGAQASRHSDLLRSSLRDHVEAKFAAQSEAAGVKVNQSLSKKAYKATSNAQGDAAGSHAKAAAAHRTASEHLTSQAEKHRGLANNLSSPVANESREAAVVRNAMSARHATAAAVLYGEAARHSRIGESHATRSSEGRQLVAKSLVREVIRGLRSDRTTQN